MGDHDHGHSPAFVRAMMALLFVSSLGEAYFPDMMSIIGLQAKTNWMFLADALGNMSGMMVPTRQRWSEVSKLSGVLPGLCDVVSKVFILGGIALSSAQAKSILYNSCIVWAALLSRFILNRVLSWTQWFGVFVLIAGLLIKIDFSKGQADVDCDPTFFWGMIAILVGCALHSLTVVVSEHYIRKHGIAPPKMCCLIGCFSMTSWWTTFALGFMIPELKGGEWLYKREDFWPADGTLWEGLSRSHEAVIWTNFTAWLCFVLCNSLHAVAYFFLLGSIGNVSTGIMKGATTAGYVALSATLLCSEECQFRKYCLTWRTGLSALDCVVGVLIYSAGPRVLVWLAERRKMPRHKAGVRLHGRQNQAVMVPCQPSTSPADHVISP